jgi:hypothetical protein
VVAGEILQRFGDHAGLAGHAAVGRVEFENPVHPLHGDHDFAVVGNRRAAETGAAA